MSWDNPTWSGYDRGDSGPVPPGVPYPRNWLPTGAVPQSPPLGVAYPGAVYPGAAPVAPGYDAGYDAGYDVRYDPGYVAPEGYDPFTFPRSDLDDYRSFGARPVDGPDESDPDAPTWTAQLPTVAPSRRGEERAPRFTRYKIQVRSLRVIWSVIFFTVVFLPLVLAPRAGGQLRPWSRGGMAIELCLTTGLLALSTLAATVVLPSRMRSISRAFGIEGVMRSHKLLALVTTGLVLLHIVFVVIDKPSSVMLLNPASAPPRARAGEAATVGLLLICWLALRRRKLGTRYELWRMVHALLAVVIIAGAYLHIYFLNHLMQDVAERSVITTIFLFIVGVFANRWLLRPLRARSRAYVIKEVRSETPSTSTMTLSPARRTQQGLRYRPGQFAWIRLDSPFGPLQGHPFTIASAPHDKRQLQFTIRNAGDFTGSVVVLTPGRKVFVDGPYGDFNDDHLSCKSLLLISAGIGITPMMSILRSHAHRRDRRPHVLLACARTENELMFRDELNHLRKIMNLTVIEVLSSPPPGWTGVSGRLNREVLEQVLEQRSLRKPDAFICGPPTMMTDTRIALNEVGIDDRRIHTEDFAMV
jgi:predicted ferric reductase